MKHRKGEGGPQQPLAVMFGPLVVVMPQERKELTAAMWADVASALVMDATGRPDLADAYVQGLENRLGVNPAHREAVRIGSEAVLKRIREQHQRRRLFEAERARRLNQPIAVESISEKVQRLLRRAEDHIAKAQALKAADRKAHKRANRAAVIEHLAEARRLASEAEALDVDERDRRWRVGALDETIQLALARGEEVDRVEAEIGREERDELGAAKRHRRGPNRGFTRFTFESVVRTVCRSRGGGLELALDKGHLDDGRRGGFKRALALYQIGALYRGAYETMNPLRTANAQNVGGGGFGPKGPQLKMVAAGELLAILREKQGGKARKVLDHVCGQDLSIRQAAAKIGAGFPSTQRALLAALGQAAENLSKARDEKRIGETAERVTSRERLIAAERRL